MPVDKKQYVVTCKGMNPNGELKRKGETFWMDPVRADNMKAVTPHLTFEEVSDEVSGKVVRAGRKDSSAADARLHADAGAKPKAKKRGRPRLQ